MLAVLRSCGHLGIDAFFVDVEVDVSRGLPSYNVVGLPTPSVREGSVRIRSALEHVGLGMPRKKVTVNLAPADRKKEGAAFDLPIALAIAAAERGVDLAALEKTMVLGELGLDGRVRSVPGVLSACLLAKKAGLKRILVPASSAHEARGVAGIDVLAASHLGQVLAFCKGEELPPSCAEEKREPSSSPLCMSEVRGQEAARMAMEVAAAGGHNLLFVGPPGIGKTMLARRLPTILPPWSRDEALETTRIYSSESLNQGRLLGERPFRAPHHTVSRAALLGGGNPPRAGEISLAHNGVLFLDELSEFQRATIECLRQPLEEGRVRLGRAAGRVELPARVLLAASSNPCPCGYLGSSERQCVCTLGHLRRYRARISGPLLDRIDLQIFVPNVSFDDLRRREPSESSEQIRRRVIEARRKQYKRLSPHGLVINSQMDARLTRTLCTLDRDGEACLKRLHQSQAGMSARSIDRILKVARTIADLLGRDHIESGDLLEAASYRRLDQSLGEEL